MTNREDPKAPVWTTVSPSEQSESQPALNPRPLRRELRSAPTSQRGANSVSAVTPPPVGKAPADYVTAGQLMMLSGLLNGLSAAVLFLVLIHVVVGLLWIPLAANALTELSMGSTMSSGAPRPNAKTTALRGLLASMLCCNPFSFVLQLVVMDKLNQPHVAQFAAASR